MSISHVSARQPAASESLQSQEVTQTQSPLLVFHTQCVVHRRHAETRTSSSLLRLGDLFPTPSCGRERDKREGSMCTLLNIDARHKLSRASRDRASRPRPTTRTRRTIPHGTNHQPFARAPRETCGTSRTPLAQSDLPLVKLGSRCGPSRAPRDRGIRPRPTARSRWTIPPGTNHSRARREAYTQPSTCFCAVALKRQDRESVRVSQPTTRPTKTPRNACRTPVPH